jgi:hypothetical protein
MAKSKSKPKPKNFAKPAREAKPKAKAPPKATRKATKQAAPKATAKQAAPKAKAQAKAKQAAPKAKAKQAAARARVAVASAEDAARPWVAIASAEDAAGFLPDRVVLDREGDAFASTRLDEHGRDEGTLPAIKLAQMRSHAIEGKLLLDADKPSEAFRVFLSGLELVPSPIENWNAAGWLLVAMGECAIRSGDYARAFPPLRDAMHCPGTIGNPWVHLRLGQVRFELGDARAADELARAYMGGGRELFAGLDPKYFALVESVLQPPPGEAKLR